MTEPLTLQNTLENLEAEYWHGVSAVVQNLPRLAVLNAEILRLRAAKLQEDAGLPP